AAPPSTPGAPSPANQLSMVLVPLRKLPDGVHRMTIHMSPGDLGPVSVVAEVRNGEIAVQLLGVTEAGRAALEAALPDLRRDLEDAGFGNTQLDLQQNAGQGGQQQGSGWPTDGRFDQRAPRGQAPTGNPGGEPERGRPAESPPDRGPGDPHRAL